MRLIRPSYKILSDLDYQKIIEAIEIAGRNCYKSEDNITKDSAEKFIKMIINRGHYSVLEHQSLSIKFVCDRGISHELVRHRLASFSQESTRFCNYSKDKFGNELTFIIPCWLNTKEGVYNYPYHNSNYKDYNEWLFVDTCLYCEETYLRLLRDKWTPQQARSVLPNALKTEIVVTANIREWREIFKQRTSEAAHPQMRELMVPLLKEFKEKLPVLFGDI